MTAISWRRFGLELAVLLLVAFPVTWITRVFVYPGLGLPASGPVPVRTIVLVAIVWWLIRSRGESWADFGLKRPKSLWAMAGIMLGLLIGKLYVVTPLSDVIRTALDLGESDYTFFNHLHGNTLALALWLPLAWVAAGFGEEMLMRGYLMGRISSVLGGTSVAWVVAVVAQAALFGFLHTYLGLGGGVSAALSALTNGVFFLLSRRNLWPVILVHGIWDTAAVILIYLTGTPST